MSTFTTYQGKTLPAYLRFTGSRQCHSRKHMPVQVVIDVEISWKARTRVLPLFPGAIYLSLAQVRQTTQAGIMLVQPGQLQG